MRTNSCTRSVNKEPFILTCAKLQILVLAWQELIGDDSWTLANLVVAILLMFGAYIEHHAKEKEENP